MRTHRVWLIAALAASLAGAAPLHAQTAAAVQPGVPTPTSHFGFQPGTDRELANWTELTAYYEQLARTSPRVTLDTLGTTTRGRPFVMLTVTSPENHARLSELHDIQMKLADPRRVGGPAELARLREQARAVVMITQNIHSTEVGAAQMAPNLLYRLAASDEAAVREVLDNVILLHIPSLNPDGTELVSNWYREYVGTPYEGADLVELYHPYVGHDNNRDWYTFTQKETQLTVEAQNQWHPMIVHDVHQMGGSGPRIFVPPYTEPVEPNVDPLLVASINQLGSYMAAELIADGKTGVVNNAIYDMFTPARAYMHYHGGARILSETASARLATPVTVTPEMLASGGRAGDATQASINFPAPWEGGEWGLPQIVDYMETAAFALLTNAARNREYWVDNFYQVNLRAVQRWPSWPRAWVIPAGQDNPTGVDAVLRILRLGDVEVHRAEGGFAAGGRQFPAGSYVIPMNQPYASFAQTLLEVQDYPNLLQYPGGPPVRPYDVTAHTLPLLMDMEAVPVADSVRVALSGVIDAPPLHYTAPAALRGPDAPRIGVYKGWDESMPAGWTRWVLDQHGIAYDTLHNADLARGGLQQRYDVILFQDQSPGAIVAGHQEGEMPPQYVGGIGQEGVAALREFVHAGGRLVAVESATDLAVDVFDLPVRSVVEDVPPQDFYIPGSILRLTLDPSSPIARGVDPQTIAWYWRTSRAWEVDDPSVQVVARYGIGNPRLSGWVLGADRIAGQPALLEASVGRGSVVLFGFQPNYRAQTIASWPLLFNALAPGAAEPGAAQAVR